MTSGDVSLLFNKSLSSSTVKWLLCVIGYLCCAVNGPAVSSVLSVSQAAGQGTRLSVPSLLVPSQQPGRQRWSLVGGELLVQQPQPACCQHGSHQLIYSYTMQGIG